VADAPVPPVPVEPVLAASLPPSSPHAAAMSPRASIAAASRHARRFIFVLRIYPSTVVKATEDTAGM
jgi:hypothetical protein